MNLYIDPLNGVIVLVGCVIGFLVYRRPVSSTDTQPQRDLMGGSATALSTILILAFLFGRGDGQAPESTDVVPRPVSSSSSPAAPGGVIP